MILTLVVFAFAIYLTAQSRKIMNEEGSDSFRFAKTLKWSEFLVYALAVLMLLAKAASVSEDFHVSPALYPGLLVSVFALVLVRKLLLGMQK